MCRYIFTVLLLGAGLGQPAIAEGEDDLPVLEELLRGPVELAALLNTGKTTARAALMTLYDNKGINKKYNKFGNQILPYLTYVISDLNNSNADLPLGYLNALSGLISIKKRRGLYRYADDKSFEALVNTLRKDLPDLESYGPLRSVLFDVLANSPDDPNRTRSAFILSHAFEPNRDIEEALVKQFY